MKHGQRLCWRGWTSWLLVLLACAAARADGLKVEVQLSRDVAREPVTGRLFVFFSQQARGEPRFGPNWFNPEPFYGLDVHDVRPGDTRTIDDMADGFPDQLSRLKPGKYRIQALLDHDFYAQHHAKGVGNFYSQAIEAEINPAQRQTLSLVLTQTVQPRPFPESKHLKEIVLKSRLLSEFFSRGGSPVEVEERCSVLLPASYFDQPQRRYPVIYSIPGFGGDHRQSDRPPAAREGEVEFIRVALSGQCKWGHHVYADSATNGPRGQMLIEEMIPLIDQQFRTVAAARGRFVTGHSSGGWSSLWLQVTYPDVFGGVWSTSPDPVDFRDFQQVNLYANPPLSLYVDEQGKRRPIARRGETPVLWYDSFGRMDDAIGRGGQLRSFEAVFSPVGDDGLPRKLWDRQTGRIDPEVARAWEKYDINLKLLRNWPTLGPKLQGKLHIITGSLDTFYLEGAVEKLKTTLEELGSDAVVEIVPGKDHGNVLTPALMGRIRREMAETYLRAGGQ